MLSNKNHFTKKKRHYAEDDESSGFNKKLFEDKGFKNKKRKSDSKSVTISFTNLPKQADDFSLYQFILNSSARLKIKKCRANFKRQKAFVDVNPWEVNKALELNDEEWLGHKLCVSIDGEENSEPKKMEQNENEYKETPTSSSEYKLFCKNLPFDVTAKELADLFDDVQEIRIVYDKKTEKCKGFAFVDFKSEEALKTAFARKGNLELRGHRLLLDNSREKVSHRKTDAKPSSTLLLLGLTEDITKKMIMQQCKGATHVFIMKKEDSDDIYAYVEFESVDEAATFNENCQGVLDIGDITVIVEYAKNPPVKSSFSSGRTILCVRGLTSEMTEKDLIDSFTDAVGAYVVPDKGFGYVKFFSETIAEQVFKSSKDGWSINGTPLKVAFAKRRAQVRQVCINGVTPDIDEKFLVRTLKGATCARILRSKSKPTSTAFVDFASELDALKTLHVRRYGITVGSTTLKVLPSKNRLNKNRNEAQKTDVKE